MLSLKNKKSENARIFDRSNYQKKTIDTFEILAAYFVDIYYNHLYIEAKKLRTNNSVGSITEGYKHALNAFLQGVENPKFYKKTLVGIHSFFIETGFNSISFTDCIERITGEFIPSDYYGSLTKQQKISILKLVLCQSNKAFIEKVVRKFLLLIIDNHNDADNIRVLQDEYIDIMMLERENMYHKFISTKVKTSSVNIAVVESMQTEIKVLCSEKFELKKLAANLKKIIINKDKDLRESQNRNTLLKNSNEELKNEVNEINKNLNFYKHKIKETNKESKQDSTQEKYTADNLTNLTNVITDPKLLAPNRLYDIDAKPKQETQKPSAKNKKSIEVSSSESSSEQGSESGSDSGSGSDTELQVELIGKKNTDDSIFSFKEDFY